MNPFEYSYLYPPLSTWKAFLCKLDVGRIKTRGRRHWPKQRENANRFYNFTEQRCGYGCRIYWSKTTPRCATCSKMKILSTEWLWELGENVNTCARSHSCLTCPTMAGNVWGRGVAICVISATAGLCERKRMRADALKTSETATYPLGSGFKSSIRRFCNFQDYCSIGKEVFSNKIYCQSFGSCSGK